MSEAIADVIYRAPGVPVSRFTATRRATLSGVLLVFLAGIFGALGTVAFLQSGDESALYILLPPFPLALIAAAVFARMDATRFIEITPLALTRIRGRRRTEIAWADVVAYRYRRTRIVAAGSAAIGLAAVQAIDRASGGKVGDPSMQSVLSLRTRDGRTRRIVSTWWRQHDTLVERAFDSLYPRLTSEAQTAVASGGEARFREGRNRWLIANSRGLQTHALGFVPYDQIVHWWVAHECVFLATRGMPRARAVVKLREVDNRHVLLAQLPRWAGRAFDAPERAAAKPGATALILAGIGAFFCVMGIVVQCLADHPDDDHSPILSLGTLGGLFLVGGAIAALRAHAAKGAARRGPS